MRGFNQVWLSGNVGGKFVIGQTRDNNPACSFSIAAEDVSRGTTWVRINVYGSLAVRCQQKIGRGIYVSVLGELMNREGKFGELTEVRAKDICFFPSFSEAKECKDEREERTEDSVPEAEVCVRVPGCDVDGGEERGS